MRSVSLPIESESEDGRALGTLVITLLPGEPLTTPSLVDTRGEPDHELELEAVQLLEGKEYLYSFEILEGGGPITTDRPELFAPDTTRGDRGRLRTGLYTGAVRARIEIERGGASGTVAFEVRSVKLDYLQSYRWMLRDIAAMAAELVMDRFAPAEQSFAVDDTRDAATLYQRFAFLRSLLDGEELQVAFHQIFTRPHVTWAEEEHLSSPSGGAGARPSSTLSRSLTAPGPRVPWPGAPRGSLLKTLPRRITTTRTEITRDNTPNRFVKFALSRWRGVVADIGAALGNATSAPAERGRREVLELTARLDALLAADLFREVNDLTHFPAGDQVLQKRDGYRVILSAYVQLDLAARLSWPGMEDVYAAGQRNVARLYECWFYLQLGRIAARLCNRGFDLDNLIAPSADGLVLRLRTGERRVLSGTVDRLGRTLRVELWFNRSFAPTARRHGSWTRPMRPDCSLLVRLEPEAGQLNPIWVHFDAKYRVENLVGAFGPEPEPERAQESESRAARTDWLREDLLKMHAYKDAIRRSVGAYIVYPGASGGDPFREYHELLPGLGAFALRPTASGDAEGTPVLVKFLDDVLSHVAHQASQHERARYWSEKSYAGLPLQSPLDAVSFLERPPADARILLGYTKSEEHRSWIATERLYNIRADAKRQGGVGVGAQELGAELLAVYGAAPEPSVDLYRIVGVPRVMTAEELTQRGYPAPRGEHYFCLPVEAISASRKPDWLDGEVVRRAQRHAAPGAVAGLPVTMSWFDLDART